MKLSEKEHAPINRGPGQRQKDNSSAGFTINNKYHNQPIFHCRYLDLARQANNNSRRKVELMTVMSSHVSVTESIITLT